MVFSSHRFGNLTRHADVILCVLTWIVSYCGEPDPFKRYMNDALIVEEGTHHELLKREGEYARTWLLQAKAFLP